VPVLPIHPVIELAFDPIVALGDWHVRLQTIVLALVIFVALLIAARIARRTPVDLRHGADELDPEGEPNHLRRDDLLYLAVASLPGAVIGGRLGYALIHVDYYGANPGALVDIAQGGFQLSMAILGGLLTASIVATLLDTPIARWLHALTLPLLFALAGGKLAMAFGGDGQGAPFDGAWATAYLPPGPWLSLAPAVPSHPSQLYEALATTGVLIVIGILGATGRLRGRGASTFLLGLGLWALARLLVAFTWRDPVVLGPFSMDQVLSLGIALVSLVLVVVVAARGRGATGDPGDPTGWTTRAGAPAGGTPDWPDPTTRPRI
jgi:prolipoprotein diacylglyceryltransferase